MMVNFLYSILFLVFAGCGNKENKNTVVNSVDFKCTHVLGIKDDESTRLVFKIEYDNKSKFDLKLNNASRLILKNEDSNVVGFYLFNDNKMVKKYLFNSDDNFILLKANSRKHFYLTLLYSDLAFAKNKSEILKEYTIKYNGSFYNDKNEKIKFQTNDSINLDLKKIILKETNYKRVLFEKDLDTINW